MPYRPVVESVDQEHVPTSESERFVDKRELSKDELAAREAFGFGDSTVWMGTWITFLVVAFLASSWFSDGRLDSGSAVMGLPLALIAEWLAQRQWWRAAAAVCVGTVVAGLVVGIAAPH